MIGSDCGRINFMYMCTVFNKVSKVFGGGDVVWVSCGESEGGMGEG